MLLVLAGVVASLATSGSTRPHVTWSPFFLRQLDAGNVTRVELRGDRLSGELHRKRRLHRGRFGRRPRRSTGSRPASRRSSTRRPSSAALTAQRVTIDADPVDTGASPFSWLFTLLPVLVIGGLFVWMIRQAVGGGMGGFGRSRARLAEPSTQSITFADVAGVDEAKAELSEIADYLRHPEKYRALGGHVPHGVLLTGLPGTGKTLLARALAGEAEVPFFSVSASEFVELYVGVGASRVRDLFAKAKDAAPAIVFIDELDAIGRNRSSRSNPPGAPRSASRR